MRSLLCVVAACTAPTPAPSLSGTPQTAAGVRDCITQVPGRTSTRADSVEIAGAEVALCYGEEPARSCWRIDVDTKSYIPVPVVKPRPDRKATAKETPDGRVKLCAKSGACKSIANPYAVQDAEVLGVSDDLSTLAIGDGTTLRLFDTATGHARTTVPGWTDSPMYGDRFLEPPTFATKDRMIVWYSWTPVSEQGRIFDMTGKQIAIVGKDFDSIGPSDNAWHMHGGVWAIKGEGNDLLTVDVNDPTQTSVVDLSPLLALPRPPPDDDVKILDVVAVGEFGHKVIVVSAENPTTIGVFNRATNRLETLDPPRCH
ncbi:MAG: hypothetical protein QM831_31815 [Kofleriaceae bacterium]